MPFYWRLKHRDWDSAERTAYKQRVADKLRQLRNALRNHLYERKDDGEALEWESAHYLKLATWNIREFDSGKYDKRLEESYYYIAEVLSHFDLIAVQEVREDLQALREVMKILGPGWEYIATDVTEGSGGNRERMVFIYNSDKVRFRHIAGELTLPGSDRIAYPHEERLTSKKGLSFALPEGTTLESPKPVPVKRRRGVTKLDGELQIDLPEGTWVKLPKGSTLVLPDKQVVETTGDDGIVLPPGESVDLTAKGTTVKLPKGSILGDSLQFARTPYVVSFQSGWLKINLCTVHIYYGKGRKGLGRRNAEIRRLTKFLAKRAASENDSDADAFFFVLGDFNIIGKGHATMKSLLTNGFVVPDELHDVPGSNVKQNMAYDQIAYWAGESKRRRSVTTIEARRAGVFDYFDTVFRFDDADPNGEDEAYYTSLTTASTGQKGEERKVMKDTWKYSDWRTHQMSDHLPMWVELRIDFGDEYLERIGKP